MKICVCRIECDQVVLADGSTMFVCVACDSYAEVHHTRLLAMEGKHLTRRRPKARQIAAR